MGVHGSWTLHSPTTPPGRARAHIWGDLVSTPPIIRNVSRWKARRHQWSVVWCSVLLSHHHLGPL